MSRVIEVSFTGDSQAVVDKAKAAAQRHGAEFSGDRFAGRFSGNGIEGHYRFAGQVVVVTIENKPEVAPWPMVETAIRGFFESDSTPKAPQATDRTARRMRADRIIKKYVLWSSGAGLIPIPLADLAAVTAVQVSMLEELSKLYEVEFSEPVVRNFLTALTGGVIARIGASAIKAIPGIGTFLGGASMSIMSGASTYAVGQVAKGQLETSGELSKVDMTRAKSEYSKAFETGKEFVANLKNDEPAEPAGGDVISKLERLGDLRAKGVLSEEEFQAQKAKLLGR
jgi:uncharacterized protein (DUF697 family)